MKNPLTHRNQHVPLTSAEIASLWTNYMSDSMAIQMLNVFLTHVDDKKTRAVLESAKKLSEQHISELANIFRHEQYVLPQGFTSTDVHLEAKRLYTDNFYIIYIQNMGKMGLNEYSVGLSNAARVDIISYFQKALVSSAELLKSASELMLEKGMFTRAPSIPGPKNVEFINKQDYTKGFFGDKRPLNVIEISSIYFSLGRNILGESLITGFSQAASTTEIRKYMTRGQRIADKHKKTFTQLLNESNLSSATTWGSMPTDSTESPFSDKLMMFHITALNQAGIAEYGYGLGKSQRADLVATYTSLIAQVAKYSEDGANIMIKNRWLEKPPQSPDRNELSNAKE